MVLPNVFAKDVSNKLIDRINLLKPNTTSDWGKMSVSQMLAHCNVTYEMVFDTKHSKPNIFLRIMMQAFVKKIVVSDVPYKKNSQTAPAFKIEDSRDFENEKSRLIKFIEQTQELGKANFDQKESLSFGKLTGDEWNNMFYKHLDHHLNQFGV